MKRIGILTGGGDVPGLNAVLRSAQQQAKKLGISLIGYLRGWEGILKNDTIDLSERPIDPSIGGTILKSSRVNIARISHGVDLMLDRLNKRRIGGLIVIGGEDTLSNCFLLRDFPQILIAKTIDNDVGIIPKEKEMLSLSDIQNYFTIGYPTAAEKISQFVSLKYGLRTTAYSHERIIIVESMGMHAGWLALASSMGRPDFIFIPEFPVDYDVLLKKIIEKYKEQRHLIIVIAEGTRWRDGSYVHAIKDEIKEFGHPRFGGSAEVLKARIKRDLSKYFSTRNVNSINPSYLYRSGAPNKLDREWASKGGRKAVNILAQKPPSPIFLAINNVHGKLGFKEILLSRHESIESLHRFVDHRFYNEKEFNVTDFGRRYVSSIVPKIPNCSDYLRST